MLLDPSNPLLHQYSVTNLLSSDGFSTTCSTARYLLALAVAAYGIYYFCERKVNRPFAKFLAFFMPIVFISLVSFNALYSVATASTGNITVSMVALVPAIAIAILWLYQSYRKKKTISVGAKLAYILSIIGSLMLASATLTPFLHQSLNVGVFNFSLLAFLASVSCFVICYREQKKKEPTLFRKNQMLAGIGMFVILLVASGVSLYWTIKPSAWSGATKTLSNLASNDSIFLYVGLASLFTIYHCYRLVSSACLALQKAKEENARYYFFNAFSCLINVIIDVFFISFCVYPIMIVYQQVLSMPEITPLNLIHDKSAIKAHLDIIGNSLSLKTQRCLLIFALLMIARLMLSIFISWKVSQNKNDTTNHWSLWYSAAKDTQTKELKFSAAITAFFLGMTVLGGLLYHNHVTTFSSIFLFGSVSILAISLVACAVLIKKHRDSFIQHINEVGNSTTDDDTKEHTNSLLSTFKSN